MGLDVAPDGAGRSKRKAHLIKVKYISREGKEEEKNSITFNPFLKSKLLGVLVGSFIRQTPAKGERASNKYAVAYYNYKNRMENHQKYGTSRDEEKDEEGHLLTSPGRRHNMSVRYAAKVFLQDLYNVWRKLEGLPVAPTYQEAKLGHTHGED